MASWSVNGWPWGGVQLCLNEQETKTVENAEDAVGALFSVAAGGTVLVPPLAAALAIIAGFIGLEKGAAELADKGNGVCFFVSWVAIAAGEPLWVVPLPNGSQPSQPYLVNKQQHVNYIGGDGKVHELWYSDSGGWKHNFLSDLASADDQNSLPVPGSPLDGYATPWNNQQHVNYIGGDGKVHELWYSDSGGWKHNFLSDLASANDQNSLPVPGSPLDGYATLWNNQQHVNYIGGDGKVHELLYSGGWAHNFLSDLASANDRNSLPAPGSPLDGYATPWNNQQHVNYIGRDGKVHELWYSDSGGWAHNFLSDLASANDQNSLPAPGSPLDGYATLWNNQQHVNYIGRDGKVHELWYSDSGGWKHNFLSDLASANDQNSLPAPGSPLDGYATLWDNQQHVNYIGRDGKVHELLYSGGWKHNFLSDLASANDQNSLPAPGSPLDGYATPWNNQQHVNYIGGDGKVHELLYSGGWAHNFLSDLASANDQNSLPASERIDGYVT